ncbi:MAG: glycoside hydrolase family 3 C-terminal domain-containing protein [Bacteroides sp.]|nr:glycoside hydrolase family 3 C-terminal domain-containing protein [Bacteroides sp.]
MNKLRICFFFLGCLFGSACCLYAQDFTSVTSSIHPDRASATFDKDPGTGWVLTAKELETQQHLMYVLETPGDLNAVHIRGKGFSAENIPELIRLYVTYDPMNLGDPVPYTASGDQPFTLSFKPRYGAHLRVQFAGKVVSTPVTVSEIGIGYDRSMETNMTRAAKEMPWMNTNRPVEERIDLLLAAMTPAEKMELLREGWGIPGIPHLGIPDIKKVEAIHGFSYGTGATVFPQSIGLGATWNRKLVEEVAGVIGDETVSAHAIQAWSPVLDVAQDPRWGRCEETYGEDPVLVTEIGGAWVKGYQDKGLMTTPKHFGGHGAPLGGRDSHDIGLSEREWREVHLVPFREIFRRHKYESIMMAYSDYLGIPVAKSTELLKSILRDEWGFDEYIVSDCGAIGNLTSRKHYTAVDKVEAARQSLAAGIATNCGDTYKDKEVIEAAINGGLDREDLDFTCRTLLRVMFRKGLFEENPSQSLDWNKLYEGWNSEPHRAVARRAAQESIVLLENKDNILPLSKTLKSIAVIGPGADDLQPGDYTGKTLPGQLRSVLTGVKAAVSPATKVVYEKGCDFFYPENTRIDKAVKAAKQAEVTVLVLGDCTSSEGQTDVKKTSGENHDLATLMLPGDQQKLLEAVCATGKPVILVLQAGRPFNLSYAAAHCRAILVNWLPSQEGGYATADVLFGDYNPAGRLPMTFPQHVGQVPLYYNFKTSGRRYEYSDMEYYPLYSFGYGLSYTSFEYSNLKIDLQPNGNINVSATVKNTGARAGDEVVQLYSTDMYASVKTRVMELKDFDRIHLQPGETKTVSFTLTPYQLSLLNDRMDRVVEPGEFKIIVGGTSPLYEAKDRIKDSLHYPDATKGLVGSLDYPMSFQADFKLQIVNMYENPVSGTKTALLSVTNAGTLTDTGKVTMYVNGKRVGDDRHFKLDPGEAKELRFKFDAGKGEEVSFVSKYNMVKIF